MRARSILSVLAVIALIAAPAAGATTKKKKAPPKPKVYCNLLTDASGDGSYGPITSKGMDILGGEVATGKKEIVVMLELGDTNFSASHDPWAELEYAWSFAFSSNYGQSYAFTAKENGGNLTWGATVDGAGVTVSKFTVDTVHNTFTWHVDRSVDRTLTRRSTVFKAFRGESDIFGSSSADHAPNQATMPLTDSYPDQGLNCKVRAS